MTEKNVYRCKECGKSVEADEKDDQILTCCEKQMEKIEDLNFCQTSFTAEHSRFDQLDDPCDDGRSGKN